MSFWKKLSGKHQPKSPPAHNIKSDTPRTAASPPPRALADAAERGLEVHARLVQQVVARTGENIGSQSPEQFYNTAIADKDPARISAMRKQVKDIFEREMPSNDQATNNEQDRQDRYFRVMPLVGILTDLSGYGELLSIRGTSHVGAQLTLSLMITDWKYGQVTRSERFDDYLFHVIMRLMYGKQYRGILLVENEDELRDYYANNSIVKAMQDMSGFDLIYYDGKHDAVTVNALNSPDEVLIMSIWSLKWLRDGAEHDAKQGNGDLWRALQGWTFVTAGRALVSEAQSLLPRVHNP